MGLQDRISNALGLHRPELRAWAMYDWGISAYETTIVTAIFPIYFGIAAAQGVPDATASAYMGFANSLTIGIVAVISPLLGAVADYAAVKKKLLAVFMAGGALASGAMFLVGTGRYVLGFVLFVLAGVGAQGSRVFYESLLPHITEGDEVDRVSTAGYAMGYLGGGVLLALNLAWIQRPELFGLPAGDGLTDAEATLPYRLAFLSVAVWWVLFSIPLFRKIREPTAALQPGEVPGMNLGKVAFGRLRETVRELRSYKQAFLLLIAFIVYNDGISTMQRMATIYGAEIGLEATDMIPAILLVQFVGIPATFAFGLLPGLMGAKNSIFSGLTIFVGVSILGYFMTTPAHFYALAILVGLAQGGVQGISRSLFASMIPRHKSGEFFGFYSVFSRFAAVVGPALFGVIAYSTGNSRNAIGFLVSFFVIGAIILVFVDVEEGRSQAAAAEAEFRIRQGS
ncbi:MAG: MFS transporter [Longimicrobiales bacterium]|nr:MFS transporter [Longimicrobiales bacterium]